MNSRPRSLGCEGKGRGSSSSPSHMPQKRRGRIRNPDRLPKGSRRIGGIEIGHHKTTRGLQASTALKSGEKGKGGNHERYINVFPAGKKKKSRRDARKRDGRTQVTKSRGYGSRKRERNWTPLLNHAKKRTWSEKKYRKGSRDLRPSSGPGEGRRGSL